MAVKENRLCESYRLTFGDFVEIKTKADLRYVQTYSRRVGPVDWLWVVWEPKSRSGARQHKFLDFDQAKAFYRRAKSRIKRIDSTVKLCRLELIAVPIAFADSPG